MGHLMGLHNTLLPCLLLVHIINSCNYLVIHVYVYCVFSRADYLKKQLVITYFPL